MKPLIFRTKVFKNVFVRKINGFKTYFSKKSFCSENQWFQNPFFLAKWDFLGALIAYSIATLPAIQYHVALYPQVMHSRDPKRSGPIIIDTIRRFSSSITDLRLCESLGEETGGFQVGVEFKQSLRDWS